VGLRLDGGRTPQHGVAQVHDEQRPPGCATKAQGPSEDQARLG